MDGKIHESVHKIDFTTMSTLASAIVVMEVINRGDVISEGKKMTDNIHVS